MSTPLDARLEFAAFAALVREYVEWHGECGTTGFPRGGGRPPKTVTPAQEATAVPPAPNPGAPVEAKAERPEPPSRTTPPPLSPPPPAPSVHEGASPFPHHLDPFAEAEAAAPPKAIGAPSEGGSQTPTGVAPSREHRLLQLAETVAACTQCGLASTRTQTVFSRGNPNANLCIVGEAPGADEDAQGYPFVGRAGQLLDKMIAAMGLNPDKDVYVCNIIKCRPPGNRQPEPQEVRACMGYVQTQLEIVKPRVIVAMGNTAVQSLLGTTVGITKIRGTWKLYKGTTLVMPTYHPSYLLRPGPQQQEAKRQAWSDLQAVMKELGLEKT